MRKSSDDLGVELVICEVDVFADSYQGEVLQESWFCNLFLKKVSWVTDKVAKKTWSSRSQQQML